MTRPVARLGDERGVALILGLVVLMILSALMLAFFAVSALEPRISRNLHDASRARWLAEAGIELGYGLLAATVAADGTWSALLATATADAPWVALPSLDRAVLSGLTSAEGTCTVSIRNDSRIADGVIVRSVGTVNAATRTIEAAVRQVTVRSESGPSVRVIQVTGDWREGRPVAFCQFVPAPGIDGWGPGQATTPSLVRVKLLAPRGTTPILFSHQGKGV